MSDYIDRDNLLNTLKKFAPEHLTPLIVMLIENHPTADVVESVRCKECVYPKQNDIIKADIKSLKAFKAYFDELYGEGLEITNWHLNGELEPFDCFYESALQEMKKIDGETDDR